VTPGSRAARPARRPSGVVDHELPEVDLDSRVVEALERLSLALGVLCRRAAREHGLSPLQVRLLLLLRHDGDTRRRLRDMARSCGAENARVRSALADLEARGLVERPQSERDVRTVRLILPPAGRALAAALSAWARPVRTAVARTRAATKEELLPVLVDWVAWLHRSRVLTVARVCPTCRYFARDVHSDSASPHRCQLFEAALADATLRVDCPEHEPV
jgi:DNA-binding MarR family transcriptional regulator